MSDDLTRAVTEAIGCRPAGVYSAVVPLAITGTWCVRHGQPHVNHWPCPEAERVAAAIAPLIERTVAAAAWQEGYTSGHSNAMRRMSDEPNAPSTPNPYREEVRYADERGIRHWMALADRLTREAALRAVVREGEDDE